MCWHRLRTCSFKPVALFHRWLDLAKSVKEFGGQHVAFVLHQSWYLTGRAGQCRWTFRSTATASHTLRGPSADALRWRLCATGDRDAKRAGGALQCFLDSCWKKRSRTGRGDATAPGVLKTTQLVRHERMTCSLATIPTSAEKVSAIFL